MDYEKKIRFGGYNHPDYKHARRKLERFWKADVAWLGKYPGVAHNHEKAGQYRRATHE